MKIDQYITMRTYESPEVEKPLLALKEHWAQKSKIFPGMYPPEYDTDYDGWMRQEKAWMTP